MNLLKFEKEYCSSCERVDAFISQYDHIRLDRVNPFENPNLAVSYKITSVPVTILLDEDGMEVTRSIGYKPEELQDMITTLIQFERVPLRPLPKG